MKVSELIQKLQTLKDEFGDLEVLITDGWDAVGYSGDFLVQRFIDVDQTNYIDIGVGGLKE
ncbi:hypothetical protein RZS08_24330 [Arthrospira platensis SPKY1]|nr:hypothetical protein [Arthrospira platensis SPKY1]